LPIRIVMIEEVSPAWTSCRNVGGGAVRALAAIDGRLLVPAVAVLAAFRTQ
jgi:hypothetical protein